MRANAAVRIARGLRLICTPMFFMNYTGKPRDVMTLAHELGHGIHDVLASKQSLLNYHPVLPLAETASTFGEMLVFDQFTIHVRIKRGAFGAAMW